jgi:hypothetical protein
MSEELQEKTIKIPLKKKESKKKIEIIITKEEPKIEEPEPEPEPETQFEMEEPQTPMQREAKPLQHRMMQDEQSSSSHHPIQKTKEKKPRTEKQMEAFKKALLKRDENAVKRRVEREMIIKEAERMAEEDHVKAMKEMQEVIVEKAVKIKKNQIKKIKEVNENNLDIKNIPQIVNPYQDFKKKFNIR